MLVLAILLIASQAATPAPAPPGDLPPDQRAAALAATTFAFACMERLGSTKSRAEFASGSEALGRDLARNFPAESVSTRLDGEGGRGCRVAYAGPRAEDLWAALSSVARKSAPTPDGGGCVAVDSTATRVHARCTDTAPGGPFRSELTIERAAPDRVVARLIDLRP